MKLINIVIAFMLFAFASVTAFADAVEPVIQKNVTVMSGVTADQCPSSYKSSGGVDQETDVDGAGMQTEITSPGVMSCDNCTFQDGNCVCGTCYTNFDE